MCFISKAWQVVHDWLVFSLEHVFYLVILMSHSAALTYPSPQRVCTWLDSVVFTGWRCATALF
eukprot:m.29515 g.29515  ORF g.29515 m.29515 type:complete len:63 (+) comp9172_c0_seq2:41-229(+)